MGEVYRARDTKLGRDVAIKVLPDELAADEGRVARFEREAKLLATLNHPNIASIYGFESGGLVLELVEGPTLAERIAQGPIPVDEAIAIAKQIAVALEAGHEAGIVHRDLKPANIKLKEDGTIKVLDYGLAKAIEGDTPGSADSELSQSPTLTRQGTQVGVILGTAPYMSPEQAKGKRVDKRADIWAFGAVLFEMLTGRRAFAGDDVSETLAHVLTKEPEWDALPPETPAALRQVLRVCLAKDAKSRVRDIADVRLAMEGAFETEAKSHPSVSPPVGFRPYLLVALASALALAAAAGVVVGNLERDTPRPVSKFTIAVPPRTGVGSNNLTWSRDGSRLAWAVDHVYLRAMDQRELAPVPGTDGAVNPFFSPDGEWLGFWADGQLKKVRLGGGAAVSICTAQMPFGARWEADDTIVFGQPSGIFRVSAHGGPAEVLVAIDGTGKIAHGPEVLPGGPGRKDVLFTLGKGAGDDAQIVVQSLETGERKVVIERGRDARYVATGHLVYLLDGTLMAVPFDVDALEVTAGPVPMAERVAFSRSTSPAAWFSVSDTGSLVYEEVASEERRTLVWVDRNGREEALAAPPHAYEFARISPDGSRVALSLGDDDIDIWIWDFARETLTRFTTQPLTDNGPLWAADGRQIVFHSHQEEAGNIFVKSARGTGGAALLTKSTRHQVPVSLSPDGTSLLIEERDAAGREDLSLVAFPEGGDAQPLLHSEFNELDGAFAPDGRFFAYASDESGQYEIYVRPFPNVDDRIWQVSRDGGRAPLWSRNGRELFYASPDGKLMSVPVETGEDFTYGNPETLIAGTYFEDGYDISRDGERFLTIKETEASATELVVVLNWFEELKRLAPTRN